MEGRRWRGGCKQSINICKIVEYSLSFVCNVYQSPGTLLQERFARAF